MIVFQKFRCHYIHAHGPGIELRVNIFLIFLVLVHPTKGVPIYIAKFYMDTLFGDYINNTML